MRDMPPCTIAADISFGVIHSRAKRSALARRSEVVNNSAASEINAGGRPAPARSRSYRSDPQRIKGRPPGEPEALATTSNQLRHALAEYYPTALEAFEDWDSVSVWMFLQRFPTPQLLQKAGKRRWEKFLHSRRLWRNESGPRRLELFAHATEFGGSEPTANA
jgi:hypothetical protein